MSNSKRITCPMGNALFSILQITWFALSNARKQPSYIFQHWKSFIPLHDNDNLYNDIDCNDACLHFEARCMN